MAATGPQFFVADRQWGLANHIQNLVDRCVVDNARGRPWRKELSPWVYRHVKALLEASIKGSRLQEGGKDTRDEAFHRRAYLLSRHVLLTPFPGLPRQDARIVGRLHRLLETLEALKRGPQPREVRIADEDEPREMVPWPDAKLRAFSRFFTMMHAVTAQSEKPALVTCKARPRVLRKTG